MYQCTTFSISDQACLFFFSNWYTLVHLVMYHFFLFYKSLTKL